MGYLHIENLYKDQTIRLFRECWALEKLHGTSAHVAWRDGHVWFSPGGESPVRFRALFDEEKLAVGFAAMGHPVVVVYGEAYGGSQQKQAWRYGPALRARALARAGGDRPTPREASDGLGAGTTGWA